jgi:phage FluMu protein Com
MNGKCPKCEQIVESINLSDVNASVFFGTKWRTITLNCPHCHTILGAQIDPIAIKTGTVREILEILRKK